MNVTSEILLKEYINFLIKEILTESKQSLVNLGFPEVIASILEEKFGKNSFLVGNWFKEYVSITKNPHVHWWKIAARGMEEGDISPIELIRLYDAAKEGNEEEYNNIRREMKLHIDPDDFFDQAFIVESLRDEISRLFFNSSFFRYYTFIKDILEKKLTDLKPYKRMSFSKAADAYDKKNVFRDKQPIKTYENGWKWVDAGKKCQLIGKAMKNCGSVGVMSTDDDRTMLALVDKSNKPHVVVTYSPNQKRISGDEGQGSSSVKPKYHDFVLDLVKLLGAKFDVQSSKSPLLRLKSMLGDKLETIEEMDPDNPFSRFRLGLKNGMVYITDTYKFVPEKAISKRMEETGENYQETLNDLLSYRYSKNYGILDREDIQNSQD